MLMIGQIVPDLVVEALMPSGEFQKLRLSDVFKQWTVLFFWPLDFTFVCPTEIRGYNKLASEFEAAGATLLGASVDSVYTHRAWTENGLGKMAFPLIGDVNRRLSRTFGVLLEEEGVAARATFIINPEGRVDSVTVNALNVGRSATETLRVLQAFQAGGLAPCEWQPGEPLIQVA
jgi:alkyl hydroperoxide reductase subunit AhpC